MATAINTRITSCVTNTTALNALKNEARRYPLMSIEEEVAAFTEYKAETDEKKKQALKEKIATANLGFLISLAQKFSRDGDRVAELVSIGIEGMYKAIDSFDTSLGFKFISFAVYKIRATFSEYFNTTANFVRRTNNAKVGSKDKKIRERFYQEEHREPTEDELLEALEEEYGIRLRDKLDVVEIRHKSIDEKVNSDDDSTFADTAEFSGMTATRNEYEDTADREQLSFVVSRLMPLLTIREQDIVRKYFGIGCDEMSAEAIAEDLGYTPERIRQIVTKEIPQKLRGKAKRLMAM